MAIRSAIRSRVVGVLLCLLLLAIIGLPLTVKGDGTLTGEVQVLLTYTLGAVTMILSIATLWAGCAAVSTEVEEKQIHLILTKPVNRFEVWLGKWLGLVTLNAVLLLVSGAGIDALDVASKQRVPLISAPAQTKLSRASFSPDDRWVLFLAETKDTSRIYVALAHGGEWRPIADSAIQAGNPRFSPEGKLIYFTSDRDGEREIDAVPFDTRSGSASGAPFTVFRPTAARLSLVQINPLALDIAVSRDTLITIFCEQDQTIWIGDLVPH